MKKLLTLILVAIVAVSANAQLISGRTRTIVQRQENVVKERKDFFFIEPAIGVGFYDEKDVATLFMANLNLGWRHKFSQHHNWDILSAGLTVLEAEALMFKLKTGYRLESNKFIAGKSSMFFRIGAGLAMDCDCCCLGFAYDLGVGVNVNNWFNVGLIMDNTFVHEHYPNLGVQFGFQL